MGYLFDNVNLTAQASSAAAGRLDTQTDTTQGGAGPRSSVVQQMSFGQSKLDGQAAATTESPPYWLWGMLAVAALLVLWRGRKT